MAAVRVRMAGMDIHELEGYYLYDTGASHHTTNQLERLQNVQEVNIPVRAHDKTYSYCKKIGTLVIKHNGKTIKHPKTLYDPSYNNLTSGQRLPDHDVKARGKIVNLFVNNELLYKIERDDNGAGWIRPDNMQEEKNVSSFEMKKGYAKETYERYGHISYDTLRTLPNFPKLEKPYPRCETCEKGKATKPPAKGQKNRTIRTTRRVERLHADLVGPITPVTPGKQIETI